MANLKLKDSGKVPNLEVGDIIITNKLNRLIIKHYNEYLAVCPMNMISHGSFSSLESVAQCYCEDSYRIIKGKNLTIVEE